ncbi:SHC-transforming protein 1-like [Macrosteles quadrilineatus]|uniref:SHC-transforming protein 1-like n=1 Tax=Macrosteles quadrilineatus TaxID=74068 RepID=UPI0023E1376A|nr:SHC-transforming protein 1-like [Macrosteles quadrilineatus]XP_054278550.1 SHC-transforming protein 1-like [Macrosteles quadrilineatus]XP_054278551.1 SHC-transforming protein 1-like [Macrosteles quadrilineatus]XP_054278552.1 SHC-transforming protein 1-like [Macrosteles quadrilineatus]
MPRPLPEASGNIGNFMSKPARGWLHLDHTITKKGVTYAVRYIGCLEVKTSMKSLDFDTRFQVAKECINRVCEAAGLKTVDKKRKVDKRVVRSIGEQPHMEHAGTNVNLTISSTSLSLRTLDGGQVVASHEMPRISFASGGDVDTLDFVAYVAKDPREWRACYVLECGGGLAQDVITTIGQAFELRFKQFLTLPNLPQSTVRTDDREYYNDLPGKVPPDVGPPPVPPLPNATSMAPQPRERLVSTNLIDLNCDIIGPPTRTHDYVNDIVINNRSPRDVFDMQPFVSNAAAAPTESAEQTERNRLQSEAWFHGSISRQQAEQLLRQDGDFLVRESQGSAGQYVLTGLQGGVKKHLLLIDPEGVVRTKDRMFESVSHLINYHCQNKLPIISAESALVLRNPVPRTAL